MEAFNLEAFSNNIVTVHIWMILIGAFLFLKNSPECLSHSISPFCVYIILFSWF